MDNIFAGEKNECMHIYGKQYLGTCGMLQECKEKGTATCNPQQSPILELASPNVAELLSSSED